MPTITGKTDGKKRLERIELPLHRLRKGIEDRRRNIAAERDALIGLDYLELVYERNLESNESKHKCSSAFRST